MYKIEKRYMNQGGGVRVKFVVIEIYLNGETSNGYPEEEIDCFDTYLDAENYIMGLLTK